MSCFIKECIMFKKNLNSYLLVYGIFLSLIVPYITSIYQNLLGGIIPAGYFYILSVFIFLTSIVIKNRHALKVNTTSIIAALLLIVPVFSMSIGGITDKNLLVQYLAGFCFILSINHNNCNCWYKPVFAFLEILGIFYSITVIIQVIFPDQFHLFAMGVIPADAFENFSTQIRYGYNPGLTSQVSIVSAYIITALAIIISKIVYIKKNSGKLTVSIYFGLIILLVALLLTSKRAHLLFAIAALFILLYILNGNNQKSRFKVLFVLIISCIVIYIVYQNFMINSDVKIFNTFVRIFESDNTDSIDERGDYFRAALNVFNDNPIFGVGWNRAGTFTEKGINCHNIYIQILAEMGLFGGLLYIYMLIKFWLITVKNVRRKARNNADVRNIPLYFSLFLFTFYLLYGFTGNPLYDTEYVAQYILSLATITSLRYNN